MPAKTKNARRKENVQVSSEKKQKRGLPNFRSEEPTQFTCDQCGKEYTAWEVPCGVWQRLPKDQYHLCLCEEDFLKNLEAHGQPVSDIQITHRSWEFFVKSHAEANKYPDHHTKIYLEGKPFGGESLWCEALEDMGDNRYLVRLLNTSLFNRRMTFGTKVLAEWDGSTYHRPSARPMLTPVKIWKEARSKKRGGSAKGKAKKRTGK